MGKHRNEARRKHHDERRARLAQQRECGRSGTPERGSVFQSAGSDDSGRGCDNSAIGIDADRSPARTDFDNTSFNGGDIRSFYDEGIRNNSSEASKVDETPILRLVRSEPDDVSPEPHAAGSDQPPIIDVRDIGGRVQDRGARKSNLVSAARFDCGRTEASLLVTRSFDANDINPILNHPEVFPFISVPGIETIDATNLVGDQRNVLLMAHGGGLLFCFLEPGIYEVHTNFLPGFRGRYALRASLAAYRWMFTHSDCMTIIGRVAANNPAMETYCHLIGATKEFTRDMVWPTEKGDVSMSFWSMTYNQCVRQTPSLRESGRPFREKLGKERA